MTAFSSSSSTASASSLSLSRPCTPCSSLSLDIDTTTNTTNNNATAMDEPLLFPCTPLGCRIPLCFDDAPPPPRPRKRVAMLLTSDDLADLMLPSVQDLLDAEAAARPVVVHEEASSEGVVVPPPRKTVRPSPRRFLRRRNMMREQMRRRFDALAGTIGHDTHHHDGDGEDRVRLQLRKSANSFFGDEDDDGKLWPFGSPSVTVSNKSLKRRNSYNALCA